MTDYTVFSIIEVLAILTKKGPGHIKSERMTLKLFVQVYRAGAVEGRKRWSGQERRRKSRAAKNLPN